MLRIYIFRNMAATRTARPNGSKDSLVVIFVVALPTTLLTTSRGQLRPTSNPTVGSLWGSRRRLWVMQEIFSGKKCTWVTHEREMDSGTSKLCEPSLNLPHNNSLLIPRLLPESPIARNEAICRNDFTDLPSMCVCVCVSKGTLCKMQFGLRV